MAKVSQLYVSIKSNGTAQTVGDLKKVDETLEKTGKSAGDATGKINRLGTSLSKLKSGNIGGGSKGGSNTTKRLTTSGNSVSISGSGGNGITDAAANLALVGVAMDRVKQGMKNYKSYLSGVRQGLFGDKNKFANLEHVPRSFYQPTDQKRS